MDQKAKTTENEVFGLLRIDFARSIILPIDTACEVYKLLSTGRLIQGYGNARQVLGIDKEIKLEYITQEDINKIIMENVITP